jgi:hypothetical protein
MRRRMRFCARLRRPHGYTYAKRERHTLWRFIIPRRGNYKATRPQGRVRSDFCFVCQCSARYSFQQSGVVLVGESPSRVGSSRIHVERNDHDPTSRYGVCT